VDVSGLASGASYTLQVASNNDTTAAVTISFTVGDDNAGQGNDLSSVVKAFNDVSGTTGVTARLNDKGDGVVLTNDSGEDIHLLNQSATGQDLTLGNPLSSATGATNNTLVGASTTVTANAAGVFGTNDSVITGQITLDSSKSFSVTDTGATGTGGMGGFLTSTAATTSQMQKVSDMDVGSVDGANRTIAIVDAAISAISGQRASYGALQSRFESAVTNLQTTSENMSASRSRIQDADFASETANLSRSQILLQAGTAMVAQANQLPQGVLALLRG
jgi:flagellin